MTEQPTPQIPDEGAPAPARPKRWVGPALFLVFVVTPVLILIFSNTASQKVGFAWWEWEAPLWVILAVTFLGGALVTRAIAWFIRTMRKRRRKAAETA